MLVSEIPSQSLETGTWRVAKKYDGGSVLTLQRLVLPLLSDGHGGVSGVDNSLFSSRPTESVDWERGRARSKENVEVRNMIVWENVLEILSAVHNTGLWAGTFQRRQWRAELFRLTVRGPSTLRLDFLVADIHSSKSGSSPVSKALSQKVSNN